MKAASRKKIRVVIADDHPFVRDGVKGLINSQPDMTVVGEAADGLQVLARAKILKPDIVVMDLSMPQIRGTQATEQLKCSAPGVKVIILTFHDDELVLRELVLAGASGFVLKRSSGEELVRAVRTVSEGGVFYDPALAQISLARMLDKTAPSSPASTFKLSPREENVLRLIAFGQTTKEVAAELGVSIKSVETYKTRLCRKLKLRSRAEIVRFALRQGWLREDDPAPRV